MEYPARRGLPTEYGLLGLLLDGPAHGYDLQQRLRAGLGPTWRVAWSQLYSVLRDLEQTDWVQATEVESPNGPPRRSYALTAAGRKAFLEWVDVPVRHVRDARIELLAKLFFLRRHRPDKLAPFLKAQAEVLRRSLERPSPTHGDPWLVSISASFRRHQTESVLAWIREVGRSLVGKGEERS
jgi:DNA-binding PadR family transcriptional regulator